MRNVPPETSDGPFATPRDPSNIRMADHIDRNDILDLLDFREGLLFPPVNHFVGLFRSSGGAGASRTAEHEDPVSLGMLSMAEAHYLVQRCDSVHAWN